MFHRYLGKRYRDKASPDLVAFAEAGDLHSLDYDGILKFYTQIGQAGSANDFAYLAAVDRYFMLTHLLDRMDALHPWLYDRCREVEAEPDGYLDLWSREHYKSTIITYAGAMQEIINDPEITIGIFSHTQKIAKKFVAQIKREFELNAMIRTIYADMCWLRPKGEAPIWSEEAFTVRRMGNPKEATVEGHGVVSGQPTSKHYGLMIYDDLVTLESVSNAEQVQKTTEAWELSTNLGSKEGRRWMIGTRYSFADSYSTLIGNRVVKPRLYPATEDGRLDGTPVFLTPAIWEKKKREQASTVAAQMLQNPLSGKERVFHPQWFKPWFVRPARLNVYIMADPSRGRTARSDRTAIMVIGLDANGNKYMLDGFRHRMTLSQRWDHLKHLHKKWSGMAGVNYVKVGYERYGQQSDDEYFQERMAQEKYSFSIEELAWPREGDQSKKARVERLQPDIQYGAFFFPGVVYSNGKRCVWEADLDKGQMVFSEMADETKAMKAARARNQKELVAEALTRKDEDQKVYDLTAALMDELLYFPFGLHDDLCDAASRIYDMEAVEASTMDELPLELATVD